MASFDRSLRIPKSTLASKAELIRDVLQIVQETEHCRRELLQSNPLAWTISVNGFLVDARILPAGVQAEACRRGLIPDLPAPGQNDAEEVEATSRVRNGNRARWGWPWTT